MLPLIFKALLSGLIIALASTLALKSKSLGAVLISLPLSSILALIWLYRDGQTPAQLGDFSLQILWALIPSLAFFPVLWLFLRSGIKFPLALPLACLLMAGAYWIYLKIAGR